MVSANRVFFEGGPFCTVMASKNPRVNVTVIDISEEKVKAWSSSKLPISEPGLDDMIKQTRGRNLWFSADMNGPIRKADMLIITVSTPTKVRGHSAGLALDLNAVEEAVWSIIHAHEDPCIHNTREKSGSDETRNEPGRGDPHEQSVRSKIVIVKSTVPCGTADRIRDMVSNAPTPPASTPPAMSFLHINPPNS